MKRSSRPRTTANLSESIHRQLQMYALAASAAGVGALALAQPAEAKIIYTHIHKVIGENGYCGIDFMNHRRTFDVAIFNSTGQSGGVSINVVKAFPNQGESGGVEGGFYDKSWPGTFFEAALKRGA